MKQLPLARRVGRPLRAGTMALRERRSGNADLQLHRGRQCVHASWWFAALVSLVLPCGAMGSEWPQFRGPNGSGVSTATGVPIEWGQDKNIRWKAPLTGQGHSNPVIAGGKVFV